MIIGILGVLDDVAVVQAALVREFFYDQREKPNVKSIFLRALSVGREHTAALVNTLVLAYVGVALPLFLVIFAPQIANLETGGSIWLNLSNELFVVEFMRSIIGSMGLILTVPIVTLLAVMFYRRYPPKDRGTGHHHHH